MRLLMQIGIWQFGLALAAAALLPASALGHKFSILPFPIAFGAFGAALGILALLGTTALLVGLLLAILPPHAGWGPPALAGVLAVAVLAYPALVIQEARSLPFIHDITTDFEDPPQFAALLAERAGAPNPPDYAGAKVAVKQRKAYPGLDPVILPRPPAEAFALALEATRGLGWEIRNTDPSGGLIEATEESFWFGFKDDIVIRVRPTEAGARVDIRSKSRVGESDLGANAKRIRLYLDALRALGRVVEPPQARS